MNLIRRVLRVTDDDDDYPCQAERESKRKVRKFDFIRLVPASGGGLGGEMVREISPRKTECRLCDSAILGNSEERVRLRVRSGAGGDLGSFFWKRWITLYFHAQCLAHFAMPEAVEQIKGGQSLTGFCMDCSRHGQHVRCSDGRRRCRHCLPAYKRLMAKARDAERDLEEIASTTD
jgi:hypothetical protein